MIWQNLVVFIVVLLCAVYAGRHVYRALKGQSGCSKCCGCNPKKK
ncbi:MAG: FeoB-associated Cys-rich membrane protein [bacterium]|nr:FeoB-associated Cys-rich membrane protein [bacterium]